MDLIYNTPIEVSENQYRRIMGEIKGVCAGRIIDGKYFIKIMIMSWKQNVIWILETVK